MRPLRPTSSANTSVALVLASCLSACASEPLRPENPCPPPAKSTAPVATTPPKAESTTRTLEVRLTPTRDGGSEVVAIDVSMRFSVPPVDFGEARPLVFRLDDARVEDIDELAARDAEGSLALVRDEGEGKDVAGAPVAWRAERRARGPVTVSYTRKLLAGGAAQAAAPLAASAGGFLGIGRTFLLVPDTTEPHEMRVRWDVAALGEGASGASSLGAGDVEVSGSPTTLAAAAWAAGPLHRVTIERPATREGEGASFAVTSLGGGVFDALDAGAWASRAWVSVRPLADAPLGHFDIFLRSSGVTGRRFDAAVTGRSAIAVGDEGLTFGWPEKRVLGRAMARASLGYSVVAWFDEGFVSYFAVDALRRAELIPARDVLAEVDARATRYFSSAEKQAEDRGMLFAAELDARIRAKSGGKRSLADVAREIAPKAGEGEAPASGPRRVPESTLREAIIKELGAEGNTRFGALLGKGGGPEVPDDAFGPCFVKVKKKIPRYELGFDPASVSEKKVRGLSPKSAAAKAGLAEGDRITAADLGDGTIDRPVEIEVDRGGKLTKVRWLPRGEAVEGFSFAFAPKAPASCDAPKGR
ncbi:hypothetical protein [Polyangium jinanense]|uniref:PDZ domain-containing protein n=1 Tax=Polyangium jinanense TaxID=2829994 RepID=A0A9X3XFB7_9BACT|nr:hypothetical protein [Polyangium jinanense]MDC3988440.1 hypothetical protein [Polyangium jinanense]